MDPGENSAQCCFLPRSRKPCERALHSGQNFRSDGELETIFAEEGNQHRCSGGADNGMRSRIGWVWCGVANFWKPVWIGRRVGIVICGGGTYGGDWPPEIVSVFSVVESNHVVGKGQVKERKQACTLCRCQPVCKRGCLADFVPVVLNRAIPKAPRQGLVRRAGSSFGDSQCFDLVKDVAVRITG